MPTYSEITSGIATVEFSFGPLEISVTYCPGKVTEEFLGEYLALKGMDENTFKERFRAFNEALCDVIDEWNITEDDGVTMFPLDPDRLIKLPMTLRFGVAEAITGDFRPNGVATKIPNS
jgi:hypothetical protein